MSRTSWIVPLLLATGVALAGEVPEAERVAGSTEAQTQTDERTRAQTDARSDAQTDARPGAQPEGQAEARTDQDPKVVSGMSILGNRDAPKSLVIVPWKSSAIGESLGISTMLDDSRQPVDRDVFMRALSYYEIRSERTP